VSAELAVLGSGCFTPGPPGQKPSDIRNPAAYAVRVEDEVILFDFGFGALRQLARVGFDPRQVSHAFFSHRHPDHVGDLAALLFFYRYDGKPRNSRLTLYGPRGFKRFVERLIKAHQPWLKARSFQMKVLELEEKSLVRGSKWRVRAREVPHSTEAVAYRLDSKHGSMCYTGDTTYDAGIARFASEASVFVAECTLPDGAKTSGHMRVSEAIELGVRSKAKKVILSHLSPESEKAAKKAIKGKRAFKLAADLMKVSLG